ncbi:MAG: hypothetical protein EBX40_08110, partial [Gammaproteobacteria bacterium]|nr:hypothetical protein [Gammaproteobacteria bacterium]
IKTVPISDLKLGAVLLTTYSWSSLNVCPQTGKSGPFAGSLANENSADFENITSAQLQNCIYLSNGYDPVIKYDGQTVYRAGLPPTLGDTSFSISASGTGAGANLYVWRSQFVQIDNNDNRAEGNTVDSVEYPSIAEPSVNDVNVLVSNIQAGSGFNTNCALISGTGTGTAVPVTAGHTMKAGDTAFLYDTVSASYVERTVSSVGATTVNLTASVGYTSSVTNSRNVISNNLRIKILRNKNTGITPTLFFELIEIPNNSFSATSTYTDAASDASLSIEFVEPVTDRSPPVQGKYVSSYQNLMVTAGSLSAATQVSFSDSENAEYFPLGENQIIVNKQVSGIHPSNESFLIFENRAAYALTGDVPGKNFRVDTLTSDVGCVAHATIQDVRGAICFLSAVGPRFIQASTLPKG